MTDQLTEASARGWGSASAVPRRRTSFLGRDLDVGEVSNRLHDSPLVTLVGFGGVGKTSLAYAVASSVEADSTASVHVAELAAAADDDAVGRVVADSLGLPTTADETPASAVANRFAGSGPALLVLDNCEQVVTGAAAMVDELIDRCPELRVLATSRTALGVVGERIWPVEPLAIDGAGPDSPAVLLLRERAEANDPRALAAVEPAALTELARRLDGVPLALELAAARLATMSIDDLLGQLDEHLLHLESTHRSTADRHRSLAGVVDWSYQLLDDADRRLAESLSVFRGSFTGEAAATVLGLPDRAALDRLTRASLLTVTDREGGTRYLMLEMIRQYLTERLGESGRAAALHRDHATWAVGLATTLQRQQRERFDLGVAAAFEAEFDNVAAAATWAADVGDTELMTQLGRGLQDLVMMSGGQELHATVERLAEACWQRPEAGDVILVACTAAMVRGDIPRYRQLLEQADRLGIEGEEVAVGRAIEWAALLVFEGRVEEAVGIVEAHADDVPDDPWDAVFTLVRLSMPNAYAGNTDRALALADRAVEVAQRLGNPVPSGWANYVRGEALMGVDPDRAIDSYEQALAAAEEAGNSFLVGLLSVALSSALGRHGEPVDSLESFQAAIVRWRDAGGWSFLSTTLRNFGELLVRIDRHEEAVLVRCSLEHLEASSEAGGVDAERDRYLRRLLTERLSLERFEELRERSRDLDRGDVVDLALATIADELRHRRRTTEFRAIVFTDLEQSTQFMADSGDERARGIMRQYDLRTNDALERHHGDRVKGTGDGVLATFPSVADALACVVELLRAVDEAVGAGELPLRLRVGVHAGETIADMGDVHGTVVNLTARVVDRADGGEILVTDTIRQIAVGSEHAFTNLGEAELKGIPEPIRLHRLEWR